MSGFTWRYWFEIPPYADVLDRNDVVWNVGNHQPGDIQVTLTNYVTQRYAVIPISPAAPVRMVTLDKSEALFNLVNAGLALQVIAQEGF